MLQRMLRERPARCCGLMDEVPLKRSAISTFIAARHHACTTGPNGAERSNRRLVVPGQCRPEDLPNAQAR
jgi:hypothetical protein